MTVSQYSLWFEAGGILFLVNLAVGIVLRPYSDFFLKKDLLNKSFKMDTNEKDKLLTRDPILTSTTTKNSFNFSTSTTPNLNSVRTLMQTKV